MSDSQLQAAARAAYESSRWQKAFTVAAFSAPVVLISVLRCDEPIYSAIGGALLVASIVLFKWRGQALGRGVVPGMVAGLIPFPLPFLTLAFGHPTCASSGLCMLATTVCLAGGVVAGLLLGRGVAHAPNHRLVSAGAALWIALLTGSLSCVMLGVAGVIGLSLGLLVGATPVLVLSRARP